ncbi:MAG: hybrid sensor histidine kinase/response regulator [Myxococcales bacterium]|nr:hybrid sensor histidine kinase/response regulator [Myxococcales bacterium]
MATILYVDDDPDNLIFFAALCAEQFSTATAESGVEALEILRTQEIAVLIADQRMPRMTGVELAERAATEHPDVVRILITAYSDLSEAIDAINRGQVRSYLRKPWDAGELFAVLREALSTFATRKRVRQLERHMLATERVYTLGVVTAGIAHEMKSPLRALTDGIDVVRQRMAEAVNLARAGDGEQAAQLLESLEPFMGAQATQTAAMHEICRGFEVSNYDVDPNETCDMGEVVQTAARLVLASQDGVCHLEVVCDETPEVRGNRHRLGRVIINLLINAFESVTEVECPSVQLYLRNGDEESGEGKGLVVVDVSDNGTGIEPKAQRRMFDAFYSTKTSSGTGLGLAMSKRIVEEVGGSLLLDSTSEQGTRFSLKLRAG